MKYLLTIVYLFFTTSGIFLMKAGGDSLFISIKDNIQFKIGYITLLGFLSYIISFLLWQKLLISYDLSFIVPLTTGISQIIILFVGYLAFSEKINWMTTVGVVAIAVGVFFIALGKR